MVVPRPPNFSTLKATAETLICQLKLLQPPSKDCRSQELQRAADTLFMHVRHTPRLVRVRQTCSAIRHTHACSPCMCRAQPSAFASFFRAPWVFKLRPWGPSVARRLGQENIATVPHGKSVWRMHSRRTRCPERLAHAWASHEMRLELTLYLQDCALQVSDSPVAAPCICSMQRSLKHLHNATAADAPATTPLWPLQPL